MSLFAAPVKVGITESVADIDVLEVTETTGAVVPLAAYVADTTGTVKVLSLQLEVTVIVPLAMDDALVGTVELDIGKGGLGVGIAEGKAASVEEAIAVGAAHSNDPSTVTVTVETAKAETVLVIVRVFVEEVLFRSDELIDMTDVEFDSPPTT